MSSRTGRGRAPTMAVGTRLTPDEVERLDAAARAGHLDRSAFIRRALKGRTIRYYPMEVLLAEAVALFAAMRVSVALDRSERLADALDRLELIMDRLCILSADEPRP